MHGSPACSNSPHYGKEAALFQQRPFSTSKHPSPAQRPASSTHKTITDFSECAILIAATKDSTYNRTRPEDIKNSVFQPRDKTREIPSGTAHLIFQIAASPVSSGSPTVCPHPSFAHKASRARTIWIITASQSTLSTLQRGRAERRILRDETLALSVDIQRR